MAVFSRSKRVTDPLDDRVKARIVGRDSVPLCGSSTPCGTDADDDSPCLSDLVHGFLEDRAEPQGFDVESAPENDDDDDDFDGGDSCSSSPFNPRDVVVSLLYPAANVDRYRALLVSHVFKALGSLSCPVSNEAAIRRNVAAVLRDLGHNAAVCRTKWSGSGGLTAGNYEFVDVLRSEKRYVVDVDFAGEFEIARPTDAYNLLLQTLPKVFVGRSEDLKKIVKLTCDAAKRSLKSRGLHLPPWRKNRYMQNKWFGPSRRIAAPSPPPAAVAPPPPPPPPPSAVTVKCRSVGFDAVSDGRLFVRTR